MDLHPGLRWPSVGVRLCSATVNREVDTASAQRALQLGNAKVQSTAHPGVSLFRSNADTRASSSIRALEREADPLFGQAGMSLD